MKHVRDESFHCEHCKADMPDANVHFDCDECGRTERQPLSMDQVSGSILERIG